MPKTVMNAAFKVTLGNISIAGMATVSGLKKSRPSKTIHDNAGDTKPRVVVGPEEHENITIEATAYGFEDGQAKSLNDMWAAHASNADDDQAATDRVTISFFEKFPNEGDLGQYKAERCKIVGLSINDLDREAGEEVAKIQIELAVASGGWAT